MINIYAVFLTIALPCLANSLNFLFNLSKSQYYIKSFSYDFLILYLINSLLNIKIFMQLFKFYSYFNLIINKKLFLFILFMMTFILFSCSNIESPVSHPIERVYKTNYISYNRIPIWSKNIKISQSNYNNKDYKLPTINSVFLDSENGYFGAKKEGVIFTIPTYTEEFQHYNSSHLNFLTDIDVLRVSLKTIKTTSLEKHMLATVLGANLLTNNYIIIITNSPNTTYIYNTWRQMATYKNFTTANFGNSLLAPSGRFEDSGRILKLSRTGNGNSFVNNCYVYDLCRVIDGNTAIMKNRKTGSFICVRIKWEGEVKKVYMVQPRSSTFVLQAETPYNNALMNSVINLSLFSKSLIWGGLNGVGTAAGILGSDLVNLIMAGSYMINQDISIKDITSFGYLVKNFDFDYIKYWGEFMSEYN